MIRSTLLLPLLLAAPLALAQVSSFPNGSTVANFTVTDTDGNEHDLFEYTAQGKYVMLDFFFDTCPPCQTTQTYYNELHETYGCNSADLVVLSINNGTDSDAEVIAFENTYGGPWVHAPAVSAEGGGGGVTSTYGVSAFPTYCLIAPDNTMYDNDIWPISNMQTFVNAFPPGNVIQPAACVLSVNELDQAVEMSVFPSPTNGPLTVAFDLQTDRRIQLQLVDALGRESAQWDLGRRGNGSFMETLDLSGQPNGAYLLRALTEDGVSATWRVVVAH